MKAIERNIARHANGQLYFVAKRQGKLVVRSLRTRKISEARSRVLEQGLAGLIGSGAAREPAVPLPAGVALESASAGSLAEALDEHDRGLVLMSEGAREMARKAKAVILRFAGGWDDFSPVAVWSSYRRTGLERGHGKELTSAANHLLWYLRKFVPWAVARGFLAEDFLEELERLRKVPTNPRRIRVPEPAVVDEFLQMVATEDPEGAAFLRFLAVTGLRRGGACGLRWQQVDFLGGTIEVVQKGGKAKVIPLAPEALEILQGRRGGGKNSRPWKYGPKDLEVLGRRMKRFAKGLDLDLTTFHAFRHYFASRCLMAGLTVQEVASLLGHSDGGVLVLKTYGHISAAHLRQAVASLRLASPINNNEPQGAITDVPTPGRSAPPSGQAG